MFGYKQVTSAVTTTAFSVRGGNVEIWANRLGVSTRDPGMRRKSRAVKLPRYLSSKWTGLEKVATIGWPEKEPKILASL